MLRTAIIVLLLLSALPAAAEKLVLLSEYYPPYNLRDKDGKPTGVYMDQLKIVMERAQIDYEASLTPWARAIASAESKPMHCVFAAARTSEREARFKWVSPIHKDRNVLVARAKSDVKISNLSEARRYSIGTQRNDYTENLLRSLGFHRIDLSADFSKTLSKLDAGRIDLMPMSESALKKLPKDSFREVTFLSNQSLGLACHKTVPDAMIHKMQKTLDELIADGTQQKIYRKYDLIIRQ